jgi:hypothetical protein
MIVFQHSAIYPLDRAMDCDISPQMLSRFSRMQGFCFADEADALL